jgi:hypothetical protein
MAEIGDACLRSGRLSGLFVEADCTSSDLGGGLNRFPPVEEGEFERGIAAPLNNVEVRGNCELDVSVAIVVGFCVVESCVFLWSIGELGRDRDSLM